MAGPVATKATAILAVALALGTLGAGCGPRGLRAFGVVDDGRIYRSGRLTAEQLRGLIQARHLRTIVDLGAYDNDPEMDAAAAEISRAAGVDRFTLPMIGDGRANPNGYVAVLRLMADPARQPLLVMCSAGTERTGAAVLLYRHVVQGQLIQEAYRESLAQGHRAGDYEMLAYVADWAAPIEQAFRSGTWVPGLPPVEPVAGGTANARPAPSQWVPPDYPSARRRAAAEAGRDD